MTNGIAQYFFAHSFRMANFGPERSEALPRQVSLIYQFEMRPPLFLSQKRAARLGTGICLLFLSFLFCFPVWAQLGLPAPVPDTAQPEIPKDPFGRTTPKGTVLGFLTAARAGKDDLAAQYLNTRLQGNAAAVLAHQLFTVLDRRLPPRLNELSNAPEGGPSYPLRSDLELVGTVSSANGKVEIFLERVDRGSSGYLWLFSKETLEVIPGLYDEVNEVSVDNILPEFLVNTRFAGIALFQWLAVFVGMPLFYFFTGLLNRLLSPLIGWLRRRLYKNPGLTNPEPLPKPVRLLLLAFLIHWMISNVSLPLFARQFWSSTANIVIIAACVWLLILFNGWAQEYLQRLFQSRHISGTTSILRLARRLADLLAIFAGLLATLYYLGVSPTAGLAGIGIGGIAVALAAQKTLENVIGGVSLIFDQVMHVGDIIKVDDRQGTVDDIGLRSTRIRTLDRTLVSIPNGQLANMTVEGLSSRDKFWFHQILALRNGTTASQMCTVLAGVRCLLEASPQIALDSVRVRFLRFGRSSLDVEVFAYVFARDLSHFLELQESLLLRILECIESSGVRFAFPLQTIVAAASISDAAERALLNMAMPENKPSDKSSAGKSI